MNSSQHIDNSKKKKNHLRIDGDQTNNSNNNKTYVHSKNEAKKRPEKIPNHKIVKL